MYWLMYKWCVATFIIYEMQGIILISRLHTYFRSSKFYMKRAFLMTFTYSLLISGESAKLECI